MSLRRLLSGGFALVEVLLALAVLGIGLLGAGVALVGNLQASREVLLVLRAADLTADLGETLAVRGRPVDAAAAVARWHGRVAAELPAGSTADLAQALLNGTAAPPLALANARLAWPAGGASTAIALLVADPAAEGAP